MIERKKRKATPETTTVTATTAPQQLSRILVSIFPFFIYLFYSLVINVAVLWLILFHCAKYKNVPLFLCPAIAQNVSFVLEFQ